MIIKSYSGQQQDMFVNLVTQNKTHGSYVEIGSGHPTKCNNTYALEKELRWKGISVEIRPDACEIWRNVRCNSVFCADATQVNYETLFETHVLPYDIDYLQVDINPPVNSFKALQRLPFNDYKFGVITFEHDYYKYQTKSKKVREEAFDANHWIKSESRKFLADLGYIMVADNISARGMPFEDWYVHPDIINKDMVKNIHLVNGLNKDYRDYVNWVYERINLYERINFIL